MKKLVPLILCVLLNARLSGFDQCAVAILAPSGWLLGAAGIATCYRARLRCVKESLKREIIQNPEGDGRYEREVEYEAIDEKRSCPLMVLTCCIVAAAIPLMVLPGLFC